MFFLEFSQFAPHFLFLGRLRNLELVRKSVNSVDTILQMARINWRSHPRVHPRVNRPHKFHSGQLCSKISRKIKNKSTLILRCGMTFHSDKCSSLFFMRNLFSSKAGPNALESFGDWVQILTKGNGEEPESEDHGNRRPSTKAADASGVNFLTTTHFFHTTEIPFI